MSEYEDPLGWMAESDLGEAAAITVVRGGDLGTVRAAFGAVGAPVRPWDPSIEIPYDQGGPQPWAAFAQTPAGVVVVEPNGWAGSIPAVLTAASQGGLAVLVYWNVNMLTDVEVAEGGVALGGINDANVQMTDRLRELAAPIGVPEQSDDAEAISAALAWGLRAQAEIAQIALTEELWAQMQSESCAYRLDPPQ